MIYSFHLFDRHCHCIYSREWSHKDEGAVNKSNESDASKLLFGLIYSLKNISTKLGTQANTTQSQNLLKSFATQNYRIHLYETASGLRFALISDVGLDNLQAVLHRIYTEIYLRTVVHNSLSPIDFRAGEKISNSNFILEVDSLIQGLSVFQ
ncbi:trafficking protein particle complex subunit Bet5p [[Candida] railenensis]|uniref:Trafficking protein particle complex subunit n=1 Tax=[Candida] railenensis TaxID=45579 RepID=A0A9P0QTC2_9ASCO|nr:trafficking protein particle complex subunit Bet5p [[Candida] railenensis]